MTYSGLFERTHILLGDAGIETLKNKRIFIAGMGGVGSYCAEALVRAGIGHITLADLDVASASNMNRQLIALNSTLGRKKAEIMADRARDINPDCQITVLDQFLPADAMQSILSEQPYDFVLDCIDGLNCKVNLICAAYRLGIPVASSMGAGNKMDPSSLRVGDMMDTSVCQLARRVRERLRKLGVGRGVQTVFSLEPAREPLAAQPVSQGRPRAVNGTISYMPPLFGFTLAGVAINHLLNQPLKFALPAPPKAKKKPAQKSKPTSATQNTKNAASTQQPNE
ncbi:MAG TPA: tRNA threonylcarbamoyladenosine dehydratase [Pseudomonadales bacterium]|nr:tRNA threonylcarbamoyladenosine dehydratase [Pseudomonadales bacterium]